MDFVVNFIDQFEVQPYKTRFGAIIYGNNTIPSARVLFNLSTFQTKEDVILAISRLSFLGGPTRLSTALNLLVSIDEMIV